MARGQMKVNPLKDCEKKQKAEEEKHEARHRKMLAAGQKVKPKRSKALDRKSIICGVICAILFGVLILLCIPHSSPPKVEAPAAAAGAKSGPAAAPGGPAPAA
eukprot:gnl/TRDRNA2_/TRDRNA2_90576_c0_seq1.p2 gnl/TRDRNA2_/TRDRNA2_90576_c0~~gnl/TRDRNA2_/TRDRNA2_90576_c0_seq1.p2  ORF type:complete len:103 (+),score=27.91 gnl/TRDRNA2_/TRDRNA2_90576_c0_seq1:103-411(+)